MKIIQGFATRSQQISNVKDTVADFFEISPFSLTYSRSRGEYQNSNHPGTVLHTFKSQDETTGEYYQLPEEFVKEIMDVVRAVYVYMTTNSYPYDDADFEASIQSGFPDVIMNFAAGDFFVGTQLTMPEWVTWESATHDSKIKIWLRNEAFEDQYTNYEIVAVTPTDVLDDFFGNYSAMVTNLSSVTPALLLERLHDTVNELPFTYTRLYSFDYVNPNNLNQKTPVYWAAAIYGKNGDNIDSIKDAIAEHVLANSTHTEEEWKVIFPDIFRRTEFLFLPRFDKIAIPNLTVLAGLYDSVPDPVETLNFAREKWSEVDASWLENNLTIWPFDYKAVSLIALNGETNEDGKKKLKEMFPDYIPVGTGVLDFLRMSENTKAWVIKMVEAIKVAETATDFTSIVNPMRRIRRGDILYVAMMYNNVNYLIATRDSLLNGDR